MRPVRLHGVTGEQMNATPIADIPANDRRQRDWPALQAAADIEQYCRADSMQCLPSLLERAAAVLADPAACSVEAALSRLRVFSSDLSMTSASFKRQSYAGRYTDNKAASISTHVVRLQGLFCLYFFLFILHFAGFF